MSVCFSALLLAILDSLSLFTPRQWLPSFQSTTTTDSKQADVPSPLTLAVDKSRHHFSPDFVSFCGTLEKWRKWRGTLGVLNAGHSLKGHRGPATSFFCSSSPLSIATFCEFLTQLANIQLASPKKMKRKVVAHSLDQFFARLPSFQSCSFAPSFSLVRSFRFNWHAIFVYITN